MRREAIYPHRSVRSISVSRSRVSTALAIALIASIGIALFGSALISVHGKVTGMILRISGIPADGSNSMELFPAHWPITVPAVFFPPPRANLFRTGLLFALAAATLVLIYRSIPLSRSFTVFLMILLSAAAAAIIFKPSLPFDSAAYQQMWLRGEFLVWILLPWVSAFLFLVTLPSLATGLAWTLLLQIYALLWSAVRLGFCLGIFHFTGVLFLPLLWFCLGTLFDLVYVVLFYSVALHLSFNDIIGLRKS
jgi:hypothetical protein